MDDPAMPDPVLIIEEDEETRHVLERSLRRLGYEVVVAANGAEGLALALERRPRVILTDIRMPEMDGHTLLREINSHDLDSSIVVMSAQAQMDDVVEVMRNGAVDYLKKPWTPSELVAAVGRAVEIYEKRTRARTLLGKADAVVPTVGGSTALSTDANGANPTKTALASILDRLRSGEILVPAIPTVIKELRTLLKRPDARIDDLVKLIERDARLATQLLRMSNTAQFLRMGKNNDLKMAINRVGFRQIEGMVETIFAHACYQVSDPNIRSLQQKIWRYSVARAVSMRALAELSMLGRSVDPDTAYIAGLLSDLGASFLFWLLAERSSPSVEPSSRIPFVQQHHAEIGGIALSHWDADPIVVMLARTHHATAPPAPPSTYWSVEVVAQSLADRVTSGDDITAAERHLPALVDRCSAELRIGATATTRVLEQVRSEFGEILASLS